eukprot:102421_1
MSNGSSVLIGSQLSTYQTLIQMGFAESESITVSQIFGSNIEAAINYVVTGNMSNLTIATPTLPAHISGINIEKSLKDINIDTLDSDSSTFRVTSISNILMTGYARANGNRDIIPTVIKDIIIKYFNLYFIKLNYNITNHQVVNEEKNDEYDGQNIDSLPQIYVLKQNKSLRNIAIELESTYNYNYNELTNNMDYVNPIQYSYYVHLWIKYCYLKYIYPMNNKNMKINNEMIDNCLENQQDKYRWVEIPNDAELITICELDKLISVVNKKHVLELGIERFDNNKKQWSFRNTNISKIYSVEKRNTETSKLTISNLQKFDKDIYNMKRRILVTQSTESVIDLVSCHNSECSATIEQNKVQQFPDIDNITNKNTTLINPTYGMNQIGICTTCIPTNVLSVKDSVAKIISDWY